jgi:tRNA threonylcarbamoyladenosine biosynthesis protein TsaB
MKILCIDTSTRRNWIGLYEEGKIIACVGYEDRQSCLVNLMPSIKLVLENAQTTLSSLSAIATISGPGAWSSLRIGAATVKQLCLVNELPLFAVSNNDLIVEALLSTLASQKHVLSVMDAQSGNVYSALYRVENGEKTRISDYQWEDLATVTAKIPTEINDLLIVGDGAPLFAGHLHANWQLLDFVPQRDSAYLERLGALAESAHPAYQHEEILLFKPLYIQPSSAEVEFKVSVT